MQITQLKLQNVRQFESAEFQFQPGINLLVGENGSGKTTALRSMLATAGSRRLYSGGALGFSTADIKFESDQLKVLTTFIDDFGKERNLTFSRSVGGRGRRTGVKSDIALLYYKSDESLTGSLRSKRVRRTHLPEQSETAAAEEFIFETQHQENLDIKPEERFGRSREIRDLVTSILSEMSDRFTDFDWRFEAYDCLVRRRDKESPSNEEEKKFSKILADLLLRSFQQNPEILANVDQRIITIDSKGMIINSNSSMPVTQPFRRLLKSGSWENLGSEMRRVGSYVAEIKLTPKILVTGPEVKLPLSQLSDGEQRLFSLFIDIARILSLNSDHEIRKSTAIVLIDEIDVHLHPKWQRMVAPALEDLFPACQFIATTHSPFVIQSVERDKVQKATEQGSKRFVTEGNSIEDIAEEIQGIAMPQRGVRSEKLSEAAERYFKLLREEKPDPQHLKKAEEDYRLASKPFSSNPALNALLRIEKLQAKKS